MIKFRAAQESINNTHQKIDIGEIKAAYGIRGWVKVFSYTRPVEQIFSYKRWLIGSPCQVCKLEAFERRVNNGLIAKIEGINDRTAAASLSGKTISIDQSELAELDGEYYWSQIIGLSVFNTKGEHLGQVKEMAETGANDVMVLVTGKGEHLIPYARSIVQRVEPEDGRIIVDWEKDYL